MRPSELPTMVLHSAHILCLASVAQIRLILTGYCLLHHSSCQHWSWPGYQLGGCMPGPGNARGMKHFQTLPQNYKIPFYYSSSSVKTLHETKEKLSSLIFPCQYLSCVWIAIWNKKCQFYFSRALIFVWRHLTRLSGCRSPIYADPGTLLFMLVP